MGIFKLLEAFNNNIRVLFKIYEHILVLFYAFKLPVGAAKDEVEVKFSVAGELDFEVFADAMEFTDNNFDSDAFEVFEGLNLVRFFLHSDNKVVFFIVDKFPALVEERVL